MKQLNFVFAAAAGIVFVSVGANGATRYSNTLKRHELYQNYSGCNYTGCKTAAPVQTKTWEERPKYEPVRKQNVRTANKVALADPFFQPATGRFGSLSDLGYAQNVYDFEIINGTGGWGGITGDWNASEIFFKEDLSFGVTDNFALMGMLKYASSSYEMNWNTTPATTDSSDDSGIAIWGLGGQWKFFEDEKNIDNVGIYLQSSDMAKNIMVAGKFGFKTTPDTTIYCLANASYVMWEDTSYGNGVVSTDGQVAYMAFENDVSNSFFVEGGAGIFTKLSDQWSLNVEAIFGNYSWHNQLYTKAGVYWQPNDMFALGLYGRASLWDSADSAKDIYMYSWCSGTNTQCYVDAIADPLITWDPLLPQYMGTTQISKYQDMQIGVQGMLYF